MVANVSDVNTYSQLYLDWYYRYTVNTTWFPMSAFVAFMTLSVLGWIFVNVITMKRLDPFTSGNYTYKDFKIMLVCAPIIFMLSGVIVFRQKHNMNGYCNKDSDILLSN